jgi:hypothetical protein
LGGTGEGTPRVSLVPPGASVVYSTTTATWQGCGFDNIDKRASAVRNVEGPQSFTDVVRWYRQQLSVLGCLRTRR